MVVVQIRESVEREDQSALLIKGREGGVIDTLSHLRLVALLEFFKFFLYISFIYLFSLLYQQQRVPFEKKDKKKSRDFFCYIIKI